MRLVLITALAGSIAITGCTTNPNTGEQQISKGAIGALLALRLVRLLIEIIMAVVRL